MGNNNYIDRDGNVCSQGGRAADTDSGLIKTTEYIWKIGWAVLFTMVSWNAYAAAERFPGVQVQLDELVTASAIADSSSLVAGSLGPDVAVSFEAPAREPLTDQELASLDRDPLPTMIVSRGTASLEIVGTGRSRQVQNPQPVPVADLSPDTEAPVALESGVNSTPGEAYEPSTDTARVDDRQPGNYKAMLPVTGVAEKNEMMDAVVTKAGKQNGLSEDVSDDAAGEEIIHLPYAVLLAILALISMIPVARRN